MGIEPTSPAWKAGALPLSYARTRTFGPSRRPGWPARRTRDGRGRPPRVKDGTGRRRSRPARRWWAEQDLNQRRLSHQIYSLARLTASVSARLEPEPAPLAPPEGGEGAGGRN